MSLTASILLVLNAFGEELGFKVNESAITNIVASICGVFVILGLLTSSKTKTESDVEDIFKDDDLKNEQSKKDEKSTDDKK
jgi:uncharacterized membrane protein